jgi:hypothetical protein
MSVAFSAGAGYCWEPPSKELGEGIGVSEDIIEYPRME